MATLQNGRILRFLIVIAAVVLTIFIYASYYSNTTLTVPSHIRASPALALSSSLMPSSLISETGSLNYNTNNFTNSNGVVAASNVYNSERIVDPNDLKDDDDSNILVEIRDIDSNINNLSDRLKYSHKSNSAVGSGNNNGSKLNTNAQKSSEAHPKTNPNTSLVQDQDPALVPTSNIQSFIRNADKILKNLTTLSSSAAPQQTQQQSIAASTKNTRKEEKQQLKVLQPLGNSVRSKPSSTSAQTSAAQLPSALAPANRIRTSAAIAAAGGINQSAALAIDPTIGIPTRQIYETGHLDVNPQLCPDEGEAINLLIIITSAQSHQEARMAIRQTWGHYGTRRDVAIAFILGRTNNQTLENALNQENYIYGDLIRGHFVDSYNNLTLKTISALEWVDQNCPQANFVLKTDDDMFINIPKLMAFIEKHQKDKRSIYGRLAKKWKPIRNKKSKYFVSTGQFSATIFPPFTTGPAYVMTADVVHDLYVKALQQTYLKLEDVFTTGIVAQQLGIKRIHVNEFLNRRIAFNPCNIRKTISVHMIKSNEQFDLWKKLLDQTTKCK